MLSRPKKPAGENVLALNVLAIDPPIEVEQVLVKHAGQKVAIAPALGRGNLVDTPGGPGEHRRIDVGKVVFAGRNLAVGMHVPFAQQQNDLMFGKLGVEPGLGHEMERRVPGEKGRILPLVGRGDHVAIEQMPPIAVAAAGPVGRGGGWSCGSPSSQLLIT